MTDQWTSEQFRGQLKRQPVISEPMPTNHLCADCQRRPATSDTAFCENCQGREWLDGWR